MMTVSSTVYWSYWKWSCFKTLIRWSLEITTSPVVGSRSPERIRRKVVFPAPFAPMMP